MTTQTPEQIAEHLKARGWELTSKLLDEGSNETESVWKVTLIRRGQAPTPFSTTYRKGCAHRIWRKPKGTEAMVSIGGVSTKGIVFPGQRVGQMPRQMTLDVKECWDTFTIPEPPTIDEVLWSLLMDSSGIRDGQTFEDWAADYGMDTDSIKARKAFDACRDEWAALIRLGANFGELEQLFQDY